MDMDVTQEVQKKGSEYLSRTEIISFVSRQYQGILLKLFDNN